MKTRKKLYLMKVLYALLVVFVLSSCNEYNYKWTISKEEMEENCKGLNGFGNLIIGKTTFNEAKKQDMKVLFKNVFDNAEDLNIIEDSFYHKDDFTLNDEFPIKDKLQSIPNKQTVSSSVRNLEFSDIKKYGLKRLYVSSASNNRCVTMDFYHDKIISILIQNKVPYMMGLSPSLIMKYKEGDGMIHEERNVYLRMKVNEFHFYNKSIFMDIINRDGLLEDSGESIHIYNKKDYSRVLSIAENEMRKIAREEQAKAEIQQNQDKSSTTYSNSSSNMYHSKYDGSPQRQFQGSVEQEEQLKQMDEMGW